jgi:hypothetical protein
LKNKPKICDAENLAFEYLQNKCSINIQVLSKAADIIYDCSCSSAKELAKLHSIQCNDNLVHFFYDLFLVLNSGLLSNDNETASACSDGIHWVYYGQPSNKVVSSLIQLWAEPETCFYNSLFSIIHEPDYPRYFGLFAVYTMFGGDSSGATLILEVSQQIILILKHVSKKLTKKISAVLEDLSKNK